MYKNTTSSFGDESNYEEQEVNTVIRKKIIIISHALELGGAERSLLGLLNAIDPELFEVDLFLLRHEGELLKYIPNYINLLPEVKVYTVLARPMKDTLREGHILLTAARLIGKISAKYYAQKNNLKSDDIQIEYSHKYTYRWMPLIQADQEYDLAISFLTPHYIVANKVKAKKKIAWIHTDYSQIDVNIESELRMWRAYDYIVSISDAVTTGFVKVFPSLKSKILLIENILPETLIVRQSEIEDVSAEMSQHGIRLLSIGRFCVAKNFDNVPDICRRLWEKGLEVYWYIIGFGRDEELIKQKIRESGMEKRVILLGKKENPYPYIKCCDLYIQPSRFEGKCVSVREAQMLGKPVVITNYATAMSQLENGVDGLIIPLNNRECANALANILKNACQIDAIRNNCKMRDYTNREEVKKIYQLLL